MTRASRSTSDESSASRSARTPLGALRRASHSRTVLGAAPVARAMSRSERWPVSWTWIASSAYARPMSESLASCRREFDSILASDGTDESMQRPRMTTVGLADVHDGVRVASLAGGPVPRRSGDRKWTADARKAALESQLEPVSPIRSRSPKRCAGDVCRGEQRRKLARLRYIACGVAKELAQVLSGDEL